MMLKSQYLAIANAIMEHFHSLDGFERTIGKGDASFHFKGSDLQFTFIQSVIDPEAFRYSFSKFVGGQFEQKQTESFDAVLTFFKKWLIKDVLAFVREQGIEDPWAQLNQEQNQFFESENENFTEHEIEVIEAGLDRFIEFSKEQLQLEPGKLHQIQNEIKELKEDVRKLSRNRFTKIFYGFLIKELWDVVRDGEKRQSVIDFFKSAFSAIHPYIQQLNEFNPPG
jgi:hypothetical protein